MHEQPKYSFYKSKKVNKRESTLGSRCPRGNPVQLDTVDWISQNLTVMTYSGNREVEQPPWTLYSYSLCKIFWSK
jgi:hypothetical protein